MSARPLPPLRPGRRVTGMSAVLLPFAEGGAVDWDALAAGVERTAAAALVPAVNMDTGYGPSLDPTTRAQVLAVTAAALGGAEPVPGWSFVAGAHVDGDDPRFDAGAHRAALAAVARFSKLKQINLDGVALNNRKMTMLGELKNLETLSHCRCSLVLSRRDRIQTHTWRIS